MSRLRLGLAAEYTNNSSAYGVYCSLSMISDQSGGVPYPYSHAADSQLACGWVVLRMVPQSNRSDAVVADPRQRHRLLAGRTEPAGPAVLPVVAATIVRSIPGPPASP
jgi:hypothetical protein